MRCFLAILLLAGGPLADGYARESAASIAETGRAEARAAMADLRSFRDEVRDAQLPLEERILGLRADLERERAELRRLREARDSGEVGVSDLEREVGRLDAARETAEALLDELFREWAGSPLRRLDPESQALLEEWRTAEETGDSFQAAGAMLESLVSDLRRAVGGAIRSVTVYLPDGKRVSGTGLFFGPSVYVSSADGERTGIVDQTDPAFPRLVESAPREARSIQATLRDRGGILPLDPTGGASLALRRTEPGLLGEIRQGGIWIYPILFAAAVALLVAAAKWAGIERIRSAVRRGKTAFPGATAGGAGGGESAVRGMLANQPGLLRPFWETLWNTRDADPELREDLLYARLIEIRLRLTRGIAALSVIAATTPLLGLLGTVTGMIATFRRITLFGAGDPQSLSGGISEALLTTKFGLIVAIPTFLLYAYLSRRAQGTVADLENFSRRCERPGP
ncbi:MAG: MotA/TolQ/ExbB proton channel family protein [Puniceicoccaceae bacterium]